MIKDNLIEAIEALGLPCFYARTAPQESLEQYITFYCSDSNDVAIFDNRRHATFWSFEVAYYDADPTRRETMKYTIREALENAKFFTDGIGWDLLRAGENELDGWIMTFEYLELV